MMTEEPVVLLDSLQDPQKRANYDPHDMLGLVQKFPHQCRHAVQIGAEFGRGREVPLLTEVVVTGMGGSAIGGDLARCLMDVYSRNPLIVNRDYDLPHWVGTETLVVAVSYSGNTEETVTAYQQAKEAQAERAVIASGGKLLQLAESEGVPLARIPGGQPPRSALGYLFFPLLGLLANYGLFGHDANVDILETIDLLERQSRDLGPDVPTEMNPAKQLAVALHGRLPVIYGTRGYRGAVAARWKGQINENAKQAALANVLPEQNHNEILAWTLAKKQAPEWAVVFLRDLEDEPPRIVRRIEVTREILAPVAGVYEVHARGTSLLARMFSLVYFADFVTVYLAYLNGVCPAEIGHIDRLKAELARMG